LRHAYVITLQQAGSERSRKKVKKGNELKKIWQMAMEYLPTHACMEMQRQRVNVAGLQLVEASVLLLHACPHLQRRTLTTMAARPACL